MNNIDFEYECKEHNQRRHYSRYCLTCGKNLCSLCIKGGHKGHKIKNFDDLEIDDDELNKIKEKESKMKLAKEELSNKHDEINAINNKIIQLTNIITELNEKINTKFEEINSDFEFNEKIIEYYGEEKINYYILNKIKSLRFTMDDENLKLDTLYDKLNELKLIGEKNMWISEKYCKNWGLKEGIREFLQNQYDSIITQIKSKENLYVEKSGLNFKFTNKNNNNSICGKIEYDKINKILSISNDGDICLADFLLGGKKDEQTNLDSIGHFGEGMKLGILGLCRENKNVTIISSNQKYTFFLKEDPNFKKESKNIKCLHCKIGNIKNDNIDYLDKQVKVIINNISEDEWKDQINNYLWLIEENIEIYTAIEKKNGKECELGQMIFEENLKGKLFIKGIYVQEISKYNFEKNLPGFNSYQLKTNRDRNIIQNDYELRKDLAAIASVIFNENIQYLTNIQKNEGKSLVQNKYVEKTNNFIGKSISPKFKYFTQNLIYCLEYKSTKIFDASKLSSKLSQESKNLIWDVISSRKDNIGKQPIYYDINDFINEKKLSEDFYPHYRVSWDLFCILEGSSKYESIEVKYSKYKKNLEIVSPDLEHQNALKKINSILIRNLQNYKSKKIIFKKIVESDINFCFSEDNGYIFNSEKLKENLDIKWNFWILSKILKIEKINIEDNYKIFYDLFNDEESDDEYV
jgi:hypothetical protein